MKVICRWSGFHLWKAPNLNGLSYTDTGHYRVTDPTSGIMSEPNTKAQLLAVDPRWAQGLAKIESGELPPDWHICTCGAKAVMGMSWSEHTLLCNSITLLSPFGPKNNDGRVECYRCGEQTRQAGGGQYDVCSNPNCSWYNI